jgi:hypothetical protein
MRFFSNDARESTDEQSAEERAQEQANDDRPDRVQSDPVTVPSQRPGSPWSNTPPAADADAAAVRDDTDPPPFHEPGPQPTAFGASTVGGAVAASATANPVNDRWDATDRVSAADSGVGDDASVAPGDGVVSSSTTTYAGDTADRDPDAVPATWTEHDTRDGRDRTEPVDVVDVPLDDDTAAVSARSGGLGTDRATDTGRDANQDDSVTTYDDADPAKTAALKDDGGFDDPKVVDSTVGDSTVGDPPPRPRPARVPPAPRRTTTAPVRRRTPTPARSRMTAASTTRRRSTR